MKDPLKDYEPKLDAEIRTEMEGLDAIRQSIAEAEGGLAELRASIASKQKAVNLSEAAARIGGTILPDNREARKAIAEAKAEMEKLDAFLPVAKEMLADRTKKAAKEILPALDLKHKAAMLRNHDACIAAYGAIAQALAELAKARGRDEAMMLAGRLPAEVLELLRPMPMPERGTKAELAQYESNLAELEKAMNAKDAATASRDLRPFVQGHLR